MDPLAWFGLGRSKTDVTPLGAVHARVKALLPDDESVVHRYIVIVAVLLIRVAQAQGQVRRGALDYLQGLFRHVDRMPSEGIEELCATLVEWVPRMTTADLDLCHRELKALCDASERLQVMRLLASQATVDGNVAPPEHAELVRIAEALGVPTTLIEQLELDALTGTAPPIATEEADRTVEE
ncbi:MAG: TerB family tellurite resistance protein [Deltaproteobacteria bacterium]|nr:TerB family tellurite resistance protein [Deltaproteobacteria bacterium]